MQFGLGTYRLLLLVKLRKSELNAWNKYCNGFSTSLHVQIQFFVFTHMSIWHFLVWFDFSVFGGVHNPLQVFVKVTEQDTALMLEKNST